MSNVRREIDDLRRLMAESDLEVLHAVEKRAALSTKLAALRDQAPPTLTSHANGRIEALEKASGEHLPQGGVRAIFREIFATMLSLEGVVRVAYAGPDGGLAFAAGRRKFGPAAELFASSDVEGALDEVTRGRAGFALVPLESSIDGLSQSTLLALSTSDLALVADVELSSELSVMGHARGAPLVVVSEIRQLFVARSDRPQVAAFLTTLANSTEVGDVLTPRHAVEGALSVDAGTAVVVEGTGGALGLEAIQVSISDDPPSAIRFGVVGARPAPRSGHDRTMLVVGTHDQPGALFEILKVFADRGINLKSVQSRPSPGGLLGGPGTYFTYLEVEGHITDRAIVTALEGTKRQARFVKVLGSFPT